jgi:lipopolysaccharide export system permease protein
MRILSKYMLREFVTFLVFSLLAFVAIFVLVDAVEVLDKFIDDKIGVHLIVLYYLFYLPYILVLTLPVAMLLTTMFSLGRLVGDNEITAIKASGVNVFRIMFPIYIFSLFIVLLVMGLSQYVVPNTNRYCQDIKMQGNDFRFTLLRNREQDQAFVFVASGDHMVVYARDYSTRKKMASKVFVIETEEMTENSSGSTVSHLAVSRRIDADFMLFENGQWTMTNAVERRFTEDGEVMEHSEMLPAPFLTVKPSDFAKIDLRPEEMNYLQLRSYMASIKQKGGNAGHFLVDLHMKISFPFISFVIVFFGAPLAVGFSKRGKASAFGIALLICFIYYTLVNACQILGRSGALEPLLAAWLPNGVFFLIGAALHMNANK